jgi:hypothetical protein
LDKTRSCAVIISPGIFADVIGQIDACQKENVLCGNLKNVARQSLVSAALLSLQAFDRKAGLPCRLACSGKCSPRGLPDDLAGLRTIVS